MSCNDIGHVYGRSKKCVRCGLLQEKKLELVKPVSEEESSTPDSLRLVKRGVALREGF